MTDELAIYTYHPENFYFMEGTEWYKREETDKYIRAIAAEARNEAIDEMQKAAQAHWVYMTWKDEAIKAIPLSAFNEEAARLKERG